MIDAKDLDRDQGNFLQLSVLIIWLTENLVVKIQHKYYSELFMLDIVDLDLHINSTYHLDHVLHVAAVRWRPLGGCYRCIHLGWPRENPVWYVSSV